MNSYTDDLTPDETRELLVADWKAQAEKVAALEFELKGARRALTELENAVELTR